MRVRVSSGALEATQLVTFAPFLRLVIANGILESQFGFNARGGEALPTGAWEENLRELTGKVRGRGALYLKGRVQGKYLLTMRYDPNDDRDARLFRDIQPDEFYPIYGDSSVKGFDAQSTGRLYVRVDSGQSFLLYGDFSTGNFNSSNSLARYSRALSGGQIHFENERFSATAFAASESAARVVAEIRHNGLSGPYQIPGGTGGIKINSERVEIVVRDRNNPGRVLTVAALTRFLDYTLDGFAGGLLFRRPIPSFDNEGNPQFVRITFERETGGKSYPVVGASANVKLAPNL